MYLAKRASEPSLPGPSSWATNRSVRPLAPVEAALVFALGGAVFAVTVPVFIRNLNASRMTEALDGLERISVRASTLADAAPQQSAYRRLYGK